MNQHNTASVTVALGAILTVVALAFYFPTMQKTALIPAAFGLPILICGVLAYKENLRMHTVHTALAFATLGVLAFIGMLARIVFGATPAMLALVESAILGFLCLVYIVLGIQSFRQARQQRQAETAAPQ